MTERSCSRRRGARLARLLAGSWRPRPAPAHTSPAELAELLPLVEGSGTSGLAWRAIRDDPELAASEAGEALHASYRRLAVAFLLYERGLERAFAALGEAGLDPLLAKGWLAARLYPEPSCRPCGDVDLALPRREHARAAAILVPHFPGGVDLHERFEELEARSPAGVLRRSVLVPVGAASVRALGAEDHLTLLCFHFLRHGGWRPLWLCDVAAAIESAGPGFDWSRCFGRNRRLAGYVRCAIQLAVELLGASPERLPPERLREPLPRWLSRAVLEEWETPYRMNQAPMRHEAPFGSYLRDPRGLLGDLRNRWPNPIEATVMIRGAFGDERPLLAPQLGSWALRARWMLTGAPDPH